MFESFEIKSSIRDYQIRIGAGLTGEVYRGDDFIVVSDAALQRHWPQLGHPRNIGIDAEESAKTLETVATVIEAMRRLGATRRTPMIAIGGGIVQDVATFCASSYMRGIDWSYYPTTLLGMVDSCIGGKSSINVGQYKNIAGNFYPPREIVVDIDFCSSLPVSQKVAGLCEAAKICFADRGDAFDRYLKLASGPDVFAPENLGRIVELSLRTKKKFVEEDEFDRGVRLQLNFGHTFGHALEGASHFAVSHGLAVGLGIFGAASLSDSLDGDLSGAKLPRARALIEHLRWLLGQVPGLAQSVREVDPADALVRLKSDKKHTRSAYAFIVFNGDGYVEQRMLPIDPDTDGRIVRAFEDIKRVADEIQ